MMEKIVGSEFTGGKRLLESFSLCDDEESFSSKRLRCTDDCDSLSQEDVSITLSEESWTQAVHREMVGIIFSLGLHICSPSIILENMSLKSDQVNTERIKSRLQKIRMNADKAKSEFLAAYDWSTLRLNQAIDQTTIYQRKSPDLHEIAKSVLRLERGYLLHADPAAYITVCAMKSELLDGSMEDQPQSEYPLTLIQELQKDPAEYIDRFPFIELPTLTVGELQTPLGEMFRSVVATFATLKQHIHENRLRNEQETPKKICKLDLTKLVSSEPSPSNHHLCTPSSQQPNAPIPIDTYYVYEPSQTSLQRRDGIFSDSNEVISDCLSASSFEITHVN